MALITNPNDGFGLKRKEKLAVEVSFKDFQSHRILKNFDDNDSGIVQNGDIFCCKVRIKQILALEEDCIVDIFLQNGPLYITVMLSDLKGDNPDIGDGIEMKLDGLKFYSIGI